MTVLFFHCDAEGRIFVADLPLVQGRRILIEEAQVGDAIVVIAIEDGEEYGSWHWHAAPIETGWLDVLRGWGLRPEALAWVGDERAVLADRAEDGGHDRFAAWLRNSAEDLAHALERARLLYGDGPPPFVDGRRRRYLNASSLPPSSAVDQGPMRSSWI